VDKIFHDEPSVRRLIARFPQPSRLRVCYEAGPTGYGLARLFGSMGVACDVIAPSLIPIVSGSRIKTDRRDCRRLAVLHRVGQLVAIRVPSKQEEAVRDLCRARAQLVVDRDRARRRLGAWLLRHDRVYRKGRPWTHEHARWLAVQRFDDPALMATYAHYYGEIDVLGSELQSIDAEVLSWAQRPPFADPVRRLACYRGIAYIGAMTLVSEVCDWRRFPTASRFMGFVGLVPTEYSSGSVTRRGWLTKTGNTQVRTQLVESAWAYQHHPRIGAELERRQRGCPADTIARSWKAQRRLHRRWRTLAERKHIKAVVAAAIALRTADMRYPNPRTSVWRIPQADPRTARPDAPRIS